MKIKVNGQTIDLGENIKGVLGSIENMGSSTQPKNKREVVSINLPFNKSYFDTLNWVDYTPWSMLIEEYCFDESGEQGTRSTKEVEYDRSDYCLLCDVVEHQDTKNITIYVGKLTDEELLKQTVDDLLNV